MREAPRLRGLLLPADGVSMRMILVAGLALLGAANAHADEASLSLGKKVFLEISQPQCGLCHSLADAGATGAVGPVLDELRPTADRVRTAVINGIGPMPPNSVLTKEQIEAVALYVSSVAGKK
jgi:mono/diheme cytochrome c family protein